MPLDHAPDPQLFVHIRVLISLIAGLGITRLLTGVARLIQHPGAKPLYRVHLGWALWLFLALVNFWWWEFRLLHLAHWKFVYFVFVLVYATGYFLLCTLLFPDDMGEYAGYREYFLPRRKWFFGLLAAVFVLDVGDTLLKGADYLQGLGGEYWLRNGLYVGLCLVAARTDRLRFHAGFVALALVHQAWWILRLYESVE